MKNPRKKPLTPTKPRWVWFFCLKPWVLYNPATHPSLSRLWVRRTTPAFPLWVCISHCLSASPSISIRHSTHPSLSRLWGRRTTPAASGAVCATTAWTGYPSPWTSTTRSTALTTSTGKHILTIMFFWSTC